MIDIDIYLLYGWFTVCISNNLKPNFIKSLETAIAELKHLFILLDTGLKRSIQNFQTFD
ncbi:hypothetical protein [Leptothermofonsia sp. ETS-13]|uniref:hypothetical protein n=1 Tax=Leptothermofonsia sp. ETS-13 TaxID=3035696 RepID=UPI003BA37451